MNIFEFKSYIPTPTDQYILGIAKVKLYGKIIVNYKHVKTKDGHGTFYCTQNYTLTEPSGEKKYISCVQLDSRDDEELLFDFIRDNVNKVLNQRSALGVQNTPQSGTYYPHGMAQQRPVSEFPYPAPIATSMSEVLENDAIPF